MKQSLLRQKVSTLSKLHKTKKGCDMSFLREYPDEKIHDRLGLSRAKLSTAGVKI